MVHGSGTVQVNNFIIIGSSSATRKADDKKRSTKTKDKPSSSKPLHSDRGVGYTHAVVALQLASKWYGKGREDAGGAFIAKYRADRVTQLEDDWLGARLATLEAELRKAKLYIPLTGGLRVPSASVDVIARVDEALATGTLGPAMTLLDAELSEAGVLAEGAGWTYDEHRGEWYRWDATVNGYVYENGDKLRWDVVDGWVLLPRHEEPERDGVDDDHSAEQDGVENASAAADAACS
ncbi:hypothetical protein CONLIGDRAFT_693672 [Coniochaeta ligniaria NRRL 30616]|uniref:Uncharacterized protein n=1 Tax=Coniochaeta ligniaria NRRL 30616 TaxID=1408157 RepID=A0A1J7J858_9PEZI|nr:hypothetical protein CONLIGDRAFT_693672 [Coniochaeta ligniaria NRRL 30616]